MERTDKKSLIASLTKSPHGNLSEYVAPARAAMAEDADFYGHLLAWNHVKGQVRDAKVALPVLGLTNPKQHAVLTENALAHLVDLNPRLFAKALEFSRQLKAGLPAAPAKPGSMALAAKAKAAVPAVAPLPIRVRLMRNVVVRFLRDLEADERDWTRTAVRHRQNLKSLYSWYGIKPSPTAKAVLFEGTMKVGPFAAIRDLKNMSADEAAGTMLRYKLPFLVARGAVGARATEVPIAMALIKLATATELVTNVKAFDRLGIKTVPALRAAFEEALEAAGNPKRSKKAAATLKTTRAAEVLEEDVKLSAKLRTLQEKQLDNLGGIEGDWLVLGDKSGSMAASIDAAQVISATLARMVKGKIHLIFFDTVPRYFDVTGKSYEEIKKLSQTVHAGGGTSIGCGLQYMLDRKLAVDGIAIVSDGGENNSPSFAQTYRKYEAALGAEPTVYFYRVGGDADALSRSLKAAEIDGQILDLSTGSNIDYYGLPNLVQTMRVGRYQLLDEVMGTPLLTLDDVLERTRGMEVLRGNASEWKAPVAARAVTV